MAAIVESVGTAGRDHSTITLGIANTAATGSDTSELQCLNDSVFDEDIDMNNGTPISMKITALVAERHDGTAGSGVRIVRTAAIGFISFGVANQTLEWIEYDWNGKAIPTATDMAIDLKNFAVITSNNCIFHDVIDPSTNSGTKEFCKMSGDTQILMNCFFYNFENQRSSNTRGINVAGSSGQTQSVYNVTIVNIENSSGSNIVDGVRLNNDSANKEIRNVISMNMIGAGTLRCFNMPADPPVNAIVTHVMSSDATAQNLTSSLFNKTFANQFVSVVAGSEDLHLKAGADAIDVGVDLVTTPTGVQFDINNRDRDTEGDTWDMGAHELVVAAPAAGGGIGPNPMQTMRRRRLK